MNFLQGHTMTTPFQRHKASVEKQLAVEAQQTQLRLNQPAPVNHTVTDYGQFEILKAALEQDLKALSGIPSGADKQARKYELAQNYTAHVNAYVDSGDIYANPVLVQWLIWMLDAGRLDIALPIAWLAIEQDQVMPDTFNRTLVTFVFDAVLVWAQAEFKQGRSVAPYFYDVLAKFDHEPAYALPDVVRMKYHKLAGHMCFANDDFEQAVVHYQAAESFETPQQPAKVATKLGSAKKALEQMRDDTSEADVDLDSVLETDLENDLDIDLTTD
jgi:tetratricopeptide (TPR) repeat protein